MKRWVALILATIVAAGGCLLIDPLNDARLAEEGFGGAGGSGGSTGSAGNCDGSCDALDEELLPSSVVVTDMAYTQNGMVMVGTFSGTPILPGGTQLNAPSGTDGFVAMFNETGSVTATATIPEANEGSRLVVTAGFDNEVVVGGDGECTEGPSLFIARLNGPGSPLTQQFISCEPYTGVVSVEDIGFSPFDLGFVSLVGSVADGMIGMSSTTNAGPRGFIYEVGPGGAEGENAVFLFGGDDRSVIRGVYGVDDGNPHWVLAGDFSGRLNINVPAMPQIPPFDNNAAGESDLFLITIDRNETDANLVVTTFGAVGGNHRAVGLERSPEGQTWLAAQIDGRADFGTTIVEGETGRSAAVVNVTPSMPNGMGLAFNSVTVFTGEQSLELVDFAASGDRFHVAGQSRGNIIVSNGFEELFDFPGGCEPEIFLMTAAPGSDSVQPMQCGRGNPSVVAIGRYRASGNNLAAILSVPADSSIEFGSDTLLSDADTTYFTLGSN